MTSRPITSRQLSGVSRVGFDQLAETTRPVYFLEEKTISDSRYGDDDDVIDRTQFDRRRRRRYGRRRRGCIRSSGSLSVAITAYRAGVY